MEVGRIMSCLVAVVVVEVGDRGGKREEGLGRGTEAELGRV